MVSATFVVASVADSVASFAAVEVGFSDLVVNLRVGNILVFVKRA